MKKPVVWVHLADGPDCPDCNGTLGAPAVDARGAVTVELSHDRTCPRLAILRLAGAARRRRAVVRGVPTEATITHTEGKR